MAIKNVTRKTTLTQDAREAKSLIDKSVGLLGTEEPKVLVFKTRFGIHTFGMKYPIDVIILDNQQKVVALKKQLKPNRIFLWNPAYETVIELPEHTLSHSKTEIEDKIEITKN